MSASLLGLSRWCPPGSARATSSHLGVGSTQAKVTKHEAATAPDVNGRQSGSGSAGAVLGPARRPLALVVLGSLRSRSLGVVALESGSGSALESGWAACKVPRCRRGSGVPGPLALGPAAFSGSAPRPYGRWWFCPARHLPGRMSA